jgi:hypothetical protein
MWGPEGMVLGSNFEGPREYMKEVHRSPECPHVHFKTSFALWSFQVPSHFVQVTQYPILDGGVDSQIVLLL